MRDIIDRLVELEDWDALADLARKQAEELHQWRQGDPAGDLINANRDAILEVHEEGMRRIRKALGKNAPDLEVLRVISAIIEAVNSFHPMHEWPGWPEGSN